MVVYFEGQIHRIPVKQGPDGLDEFTGKIRCVGLRLLPCMCCMRVCWGAVSSATCLPCASFLRRRTPPTAAHSSPRGSQPTPPVVSEHSSMTSCLPACLPVDCLLPVLYRELFRLPEDVDISLTFGCKEPMSGSHLKLEGMGAFDAAVHCASVAAAERQQKIKKSYSTGNLGATTGLPADRDMGRSASINNITAANAAGGGSPALSAPATPPPAAGASAAAPAAQDRRQRFPAQHGAPGQQRSRSFSAFSSSGPRSTGAEQPAAFRNILSMLNGSTQAAGGGQQQHSAGAGANQQAASPRSGLPPAGTVRFVEPPAAVTAEPSAAAGLRPARRSDRLSLRNISGLKDVPEADETVAVGSLSGKFKLSFKAFSRKVARSLSFTSKDGKPSPVAAGSSGSSAGSFTGSITSMEELPSSGSSPAAAGAPRDSFSITSNSSNSQYGRASPLPPATPPSIYSC